MKLSDLSKRDYIAIEVVGHFVANPFFDAKKMTECAYMLADAMIAHAGAPARDHELEELRALTASLQRSNEVLRLVPPTERAATIALEQIWEFLGVNNQTATMQMLRDAFPELGK